MNTLPHENDCYLRYRDDEYRMYRVARHDRHHPRKGTPPLVAYLLDSDTCWRRLIHRLYAPPGNPDAGGIYGIDLAFCKAAYPQIPPTLENSRKILEDVLLELHHAKFSDTFFETENDRPHHEIHEDFNIYKDFNNAYTDEFVQTTNEQNGRRASPPHYSDSYLSGHKARE